MGPIRIDPDQLNQIAQSCQASSSTLTNEASNMKSQIDRLYEAIQGVPGLAVGHQFEDLNRVLSQLSGSLDEANQYIRDIVGKVETFVNGLRG